MIHCDCCQSQHTRTYWETVRNVGIVTLIDLNFGVFLTCILFTLFIESVVLQSDWPHVDLIHQLCKLCSVSFTDLWNTLQCKCHDHQHWWRISLHELTFLLFLLFCILWNCCSCCSWKVTILIVLTHYGLWWCSGWLRFLCCYFYCCYWHHQTAHQVFDDVTHLQSSWQSYHYCHTYVQYPCLDVQHLISPYLHM